jgi:DNA-binding NtrC family response regulator
VFPLEIPPLRERPEDVAAIVQARVLFLSRRMKRSVPRISPATLAQLCRAPWPGNVRELENALERALILSGSDELAMPVSGELARVAPSTQLESLRSATQRCIVAALEASAGKIYGAGGAAEILGLKPSTLQTKMEKLGIKRRG